MSVVSPVVPEPHHLRWLIRKQSPLRRPAVQLVLFSRMLSNAGAAMLVYGAMVHVARSDSTQIDISLLSAASALAALTFGLRGGAVADSLPKRVALSLSYGLQAAMCFVIPGIFGSDLPPLLALVFAISLLAQITTPAIKVASTLVSTAEDLAIMTIYLNLATGAGSAIGMAVLTPVLLNSWGIEGVLYGAGAAFALASIRAIRIPVDDGTARSVHTESVGTDGPSLLHFRNTAAWLVSRRAVSTMILAGSAVSVLSGIFDSLQPLYVQDVLGSDPAYAIYIFAPGAIGTILGAIAAVLLIRWRSERWLAVISLLVFTVAMILFGLIDFVAPMLSGISPLRLLNRFDRNPSDLILAAGMIAILVEFAQAAASTCVQAYIQRRVPYEEQGSTFGVQNFLTHGLGVLGTLTLGALATVFGTRTIFLIAPPLVAGGVIGLIRSSYRLTDEPLPTREAVIHQFWDETAGE